MSDQVALLPALHPPFRQIGNPGAPCGGRSACTDSVGAEIVRRDRGRTITPATFRASARPNDQSPCAGLTPGQFLIGLRAFGVKGYDYADHVTVSDVLEATDRGIVLVGVNYGAYPVPSECQIGGRVDLGFTGAHAVSVWGRRKLADGHWYAWVRDPDHHYSGHDGSRTAPPYDRCEMKYLGRAMNALPGTSGWRVTFAIWRPK
jgi:hypothetical protein